MLYLLKKLADKKWRGILAIIVIVFASMVMVPFVGVKVICSLPVPDRYSDDLKKEFQEVCSGSISGTKGVFMYDENTPINEVPMYGFDNYEQYLNERKPELAEVNDKFIKDVDADIVKFNSNRQEASDDFVQIGWEYFYKKDFKTAIKRFNQAWLVKNNNPNAYWGFSYLAGAQGNCVESLKMSEKTLEVEMQTGVLNKTGELGNFYVDYGTNLLSCYGNYDKSEQYLKKAVEVFEKSLAIKYTPRKCLYSQMAFALYYLGDPKKSLEKIKLAEEFEATGCEQVLLEELKKEIKIKSGEGEK